MINKKKKILKGTIFSSPFSFLVSVNDYNFIYYFLLMHNQSQARNPDIVDDRVACFATAAYRKLLVYKIRD